MCVAWSSTSTEHLVEDPRVGSTHTVPREVLDGGAEICGREGAIERGRERVGERLGISGGDEEAVLAVLDQLGDAADARGDHGSTRSERFEDHVRAALAA